MIRRRWSDAPLALTSDGEVVINVRTFSLAKGMEEALATAQELEGVVFVGIALSSGERSSAMKRLANAAEEAAAHIVGARHERDQRRRRATARKRRKTAS